MEYDPGQVSLDALLLAYFYVIDPTVQNRQGNDRGSQYQTGVYFTNESARETVKRIAVPSSDGSESPEPITEGIHGAGAATTAAVFPLVPVICPESWLKSISAVACLNPKKRTRKHVPLVICQ